MFGIHLKTVSLATACILSGCDGDPFFPDPVTVSLEARVSGGIAGIDYTVGIDGETGRVVGVACVSGCSFDDGEVLLRLPDRQVAEVFETVFRTGIRSGGRDYGDGGCCDQVYSQLTWTEPGISNTISGSSSTLPSAVQRAVDAVIGVASGAQPVVVDFTTTPNDWPLDALDMGEHEIEGDLLTVTLEHGGGCELHAYGLVAWNGWLESNPVQVGATLVHEDFDDPCDAFLSVEHTFDLTPLRIAYREVYGPGPATLLINVSEPGRPAGEAEQLTYTF